MPEEMRKRPALSRRRAVASSAAPAEAQGGAPVPTQMGSACGHMGCGGRTCNVRYVGAVSHIRDHHAMHAARGVGHIWAASIITGFAVVLTGVVAFQSAQAKTTQENVAVRQTSQSELRQVMERLNRLERLMQDTRQACVGEEVETEERAQPATDADQLLLKKKLEQGRLPVVPPAAESGN